MKRSAMHYFEFEMGNNVMKDTVFTGYFKSFLAGGKCNPNKVVRIIPFKNKPFYL